MLKPVLKLPPLPASLALVSMAIGAVVLIALTALTIIPVVMGVALVLAWGVALLLLGWAGVEALAALERWFETDPRFKR
jgi:hypothetical protein